MSCISGKHEKNEGLPFSEAFCRLLQLLNGLLDRRISAWCMESYARDRAINTMAVVHRAASR